MNRTQIYITESQRKKLQTIARRNKTTTSALIRSMLQKQLEEVDGGGSRKTNPKKKEETLTEAAERISRTGKSGPKDLASNLDRYLYGEI